MNKIECTVGDVTDNFDNLRVPLSANERKSLARKFPYYGAQNIIDYVDNYLFDGEYILVAEDGENLNSQRSNVCNLVNGKFWVNNHAHIIKANNGFNTKYIYYYLNLLNFKPFVTGSAQPKLTKDNLSSIPLRIHAKADQIRIACFLHRLDQKIELNNKINAELEAMAKLIYDYWFVQFDFPDANGKPYKSSGGKMVYNEILKREIPEGWGNTTLGEIADLYQPQTISEKQMNPDGAYLVYGANGVIGRYGEYNHDECVVTITCRGNSCGTINTTRPYSWITGNAMVVNPRLRRMGIDYILNSLSWGGVSSVITGSAQPQITRSNLSPLKLLAPDPKIIEDYFEQANPNHTRRIKSEEENEKLLALRDWLLPMLMNGQVTVNS